MKAIYFTPYPKENRRELFDREKELNEIIKAVEAGERLILILGVRRVGKTSVLNVFLKESGLPYMKIDVSGLESESASLQLLYRKMSKELWRNLQKVDKLKEFLRGIKGLKIGPVSLEVDLKRRPSIVEIIEAINDWALKENKRFIIAFDEAQNLRFIQGKGINFLQLFKYCLDNLSGIAIILTGSEVGLLHDFLRLDDTKSPLYGRFVREITVERFDRNKSLSFLKAGFAEVGMKVKETELKEVVKKLDGIVGWLALFGYVVTTSGTLNKKALKKFQDAALNLLNEEIDKLARKSRRYLHILKAIASGFHSWSKIKEEVERIEGVIINDASFNRSLESLIKMGYVEKRRGSYRIIDPMVKEAVKRIYSRTRN